MLNFNYGISSDQIVEQGEAMGMKGNCNWKIYSYDKNISEDKYLWNIMFCRLGVLFVTDIQGISSKKS